MKTNEEVLKEKLNQLFKRVRKDGAIARQNHLCCSTCASYDLYQRAKEKQPVMFYHGQDNANVRAGVGVHLRYGVKFDGYEGPEHEKLVLAFARKIVDHAKAVGLKVDWNGDTDKCIWVS